MAKKSRKQDQPNKKKRFSLFAALFSPADELEDERGLLDDGPAGEDYGYDGDEIDYDTEFDDEDGIDYDTEFDDEDEIDYNAGPEGAPASSVDENGELIHLFSDDEVEYSEEQDFQAADSLVWEDGERVVTDYAPLPEAPGRGSADTAARRRGKREAGRSGLPDDRDLLGGAPLPEEINLFDGGDEPSARLSSGRTRIFRTGGGATARININETQTIRAVDAAQRKRRAQEAERKHAIYVAKKQRKEKRRDFFKRMTMNFVFGAFILIAVIAAVYYTFLLSDIVVVGNETYSAQYIAELSGLRLGQHMFFADLEQARENIVENPYLQVNEISYIFPSRVRIDITERREVAGIIGLDYNVIIDHNGYVLSMSGGTDLSDLVQVTGVSMTGFQLGQRIGESSDFATASLISLIEKLEEFALIDHIRSIDMTTPLAIVMYTDNGFKIHLGQPTELDSKFTALQKLLPRFEEQGIFTGTLYLSAKGGTVYSPQGAGASASAADPNAPADPNEPTDPNAPTDPGATMDPYATTDPYGATPDPWTPTETPQPATPSPIPLQPGGGDGFQG